MRNTLRAGFTLATPLPPREQIELAIETLLSVLDALDGDSDLGPNGDELDGTGAEDDFMEHSGWRGEPGCPVSDPGGGNIEDWGEDGDEDCDEVKFAAAPRYGINQTLSPVNEI